MKTKILIISIIFAFNFVFIHNASAQGTAIFYDDFESSVENWDLESGWSVILDKGNKILQGTQHKFATAYLEGTANKLELRLKLLEGSMHLNIRSLPMPPEGQNRYFIGLSKNSSYIQKQVANDFQSLQDRGMGISLNEWHDIKIEIINNRINVFSDNNLITWAEDKNFLPEGGISFETFDDSIAHIDDVKVEMSMSEAQELKAQELFPNGEHKGDLILKGRDFLVLEGGSFEQFGNIYLKNSSKLVIRDSTFKITRYQRLLNHWGIYLDDAASLEIENSKLIPGEDTPSEEAGGTLFVINARGRARVTMKNSPTKIHLFMMFENAKAVVENSEIVGIIGGLVSASGKADVKVINSKIGAVSLDIPDGATFEAEGLGTGFFKDWSLQKSTKVSGIGYNITLINTELVEDDIGPGPFERGWPVFIDSGAKVKIRDSELRKVVVVLRDEKAQFSNFYLEKPADFNYRDIHLENVKVMGQWGIFLHGSSDVDVRDSDAFWTFIYDDSKLSLINTHMDEFDPRNFRGEMVFENAIWDTAAEIIENNDFVIKGGLEIRPIGGFSWQDSKVTRVYDAIGKPGAELTLTKGKEVIWSGALDKEGKTSFSLEFDDVTFNDSWILKDNLGHTQEITFFAKTPVDIEQSLISKFISKIKYKISSGPPPAPMKFIVPIGGLVIFVTIFFFLRKRIRRIKVR